MSELAKAIVAAQQAVQSVEKTGVDDFIKGKNGKGRKYARMEDLIEEGRRVLNAVGLSARVVRTETISKADILVLVITTRLSHVSGESEEHSHEIPIVEGPGKPLDKAIATSRTYGIGYYFRDLLNIPRVEEGTDVDQRDDRKHEPSIKAYYATEVRKKTEGNRSASATIALAKAMIAEQNADPDHTRLEESLQSSLVGAFMAKIDKAADLGALKVVADEIRKQSVDEEAKAFLTERYIAKRAELSPQNGSAA